MQTEEPPDPRPRPVPEADDYAEGRPDGPPAPIRVAERVQLTGWIGLFIALAVATGAVVYFVTDRGPNARWIGSALALTALVFALAGGYLVAVGYLERPPRGDLLLMANLVVVTTILGVGFTGLLAPMIGLAAACLTPGAPWEGWLLLAIPLTPLVLSGVVAVKHRRRSWRSFAPGWTRRPRDVRCG